MNIFITDHLWGHKLRGTHHSPDLGPLHELDSTAHVHYLDVSATSLGDDNVFWLDIKMNNVFTVEII